MADARDITTVDEADSTDAGLRGPEIAAEVA
jgi:hypothetical protein